LRCSQTKQQKEAIMAFWLGLMIGTSLGACFGYVLSALMWAGCDEATPLR
jgi:uncharacterized membrane-anchored protein